MTSFTNTIICEMAVLNLSASTSTPTLAIVWCSRRCVAVSGATSLSASEPSSFTNSRHTRSRKREMPSTLLELHGFMASSGPMNIS